MSAKSVSPLSPGPPTDGLPVPRRYWAIAAIVLAIAMSVLDSTIVNIALPSIARDFGATSAASIWVINAYQLAILVVLLPLASLGEVVGYRRVSQAGLAVFTLASLACACAPTLLTLSIARVIQGLGAAGIMSVSAALVRFTYPQRDLGRALGINTFVVATCAALGPTIASAVLAVAQWRWLFGINVPLGVITILIAIRALPDTERAQLCGRGALCRHLRTAAERAAVPRASRRNRARARADRLRLRARMAAGTARVAACRAAHSLRPAAHPCLFPVARDIGVLVHGADECAGGAAVRDPAARSQCSGHGPVHDALAAGAGGGGTTRRQARGSPCGRPARRARATGHGRGAGVARVPSGEQHPRGICVAYGAVRCGLRLLPGAQ